MILVAGFASTIFLPLTAVLVEHEAGARTLVILAVLYGVVAVPLHALVVRRPPRPPARHRPHGMTAVAVLRAALHDSRFWFLAVAFVAHAGAMSAMTVHLVGFLASKGHAATLAATIAGLLGVLSVTGRLVLTGAQRRIRLTTVVAGRVPGAGDGRRGAAPRRRNGRRGDRHRRGVRIGFRRGQPRRPRNCSPTGTAPTAYGTIAGVLATPVTLAKATAPLAAAGILGATGSYGPVLLGVSGACLVAAIGVLARASTPSPTPNVVGDP